MIAAIVGNLAIAVAKFIAAAFSGSAAMLSEAIHSLVDTGNGALMLVGMHRSKKPADPDHPFGFSHELYFWTLMVGVLIFGLGGGMSILTGVMHIRSGQGIEDTGWNYAVLAIAMVFEGISWWFGWRAFSGEMRGRGIVETIRSYPRNSPSINSRPVTLLFSVQTRLTGVPQKTLPPACLTKSAIRS